VPIVVVSTDHSQTRARRLRGSVSAIVHKPFTPEQLRDTISYVLGYGLSRGLAEPPSPAEQRDALHEVANVICGSLLPAIAGTDQVFTLAAGARARRGRSRPEAGEIRKADPEAKVATLTSEGQMGKVRQARCFGARAFVVKSCGAARLITSSKRVLFS